jgi:hypothetical protein
VTRFESERTRRLCAKAALFVVACALAANLAFAVLTLGRTLDGVEGEVLFEASRLRQNLALYVDPLRGAFDYGPVPSRYYVLYLPLWAKLLSFVPATAATTVARVAALLLWFGLLAALPFSSKRELFRSSAWAAAFVGGTYTLTLFAAAGRPDALAVALAGAATLRSVKRERVDALSSVLFALAVCVKPNVMGLAVGCCATDLWFRRGRALVDWLAGAVVLAAVLGALHFATEGAWLTHLLRSTAQPFSADQWWNQALGRAQMMGAFVAVAIIAGWFARQERRVAFALGAAIASLGFALVWAAKIGSASNYWLEPCVAAILVYGQAPLAPLASRLGRAAAPLLLLQSLWSDVASLRSCTEWRGRVAERRRALELAREGLDPSAIVIADEPGLEVELDGRLIATPFQMTHLVRRGLYPASMWMADVRRDEIRGAVMRDDLLERPPDAVDIAHDRFPPELRVQLRELFALRAVRGEFYIYRRKSGTE